MNASIERQAKGRRCLVMGLGAFGGGLGVTRALARAGAVEVLKKYVKGMSDAELGALYDRLIGPGGLNPHAEVNVKGVETVLNLRSVYGEAKGPTPPVTRYVDTSFAERAKAGK